MSETYLLNCECGKRTPVAPSQAGGEVRCACGVHLDVPPLRALRRLPMSTETGDGGQEDWSGKQRLWVIGVLLILAGVALGGFTLWNRPPPPDDAIKSILLESAHEFRQRAGQFTLPQVRDSFAKLSNVDLRKFANDLNRHPYHEEYRRRMAQSDTWVLVAWGLAGLGVVVIVVVIASTHVLASFEPKRKSKAAADKLGERGARRRA